MARTASISELAYESGLPWKEIDITAGSLEDSSTSTKASAEHDPIL